MAVASKELKQQGVGQLETLSMKATGIDLAGVKSRPSGLCIMDDTLRSSSCLLYTDNEILDKTLKCAPDVVVIDAPLALPRGRESLMKRSCLVKRFE